MFFVTDNSDDLNDSDGSDVTSYFLNIKRRSSCLAFLCERVPALRFEVELLSVTGHEFLSEFGAGDIANLFHIRESSHQFVGGERHGEKEFIVFTSVECGGIDVHAKLFGGKGGLIIDWDFLFIDSAAHAALFADVHQFGRENSG